MKTVLFLEAWDKYAAGTEGSFPPALAEDLIAAGVAKECDDHDHAD